MTAIAILPHREVRFDHDTGDYLLFLDSRFVGYAKSEPAGMSKLHEIAHSLVQLPESESCPPIECHDLATMMRQSPNIGYATLALLSPEQLTMQALCYAAYANAILALDITTEAVLNHWNKAMYRRGLKYGPVL